MNSPFNGRFQVTQKFKGADHDGLDLVGLDSKEIHSTVNGTVRYAGWENSKNHRQGFGQYVCVRSDSDGNYYYFGHMSEIKAKTGDKVKIGQVIGIEGDTGYSFGSHCHYCVRKNYAKGNFLNVCEISGIPNELGIYDDGAAAAKPKNTTPSKSVDEVAKEVINGKWGNGADRKKKLEAAGYNYKEVQSKVDELLKVPTYNNITTNGKPVSPAQSRNDSLAGTYTVKVDALNMRYQPNVLTQDNVIRVLKRGDKLQNYGFYTQFGATKWLLITYEGVTGWVSSAFVGK